MDWKAFLKHVLWAAGTVLSSLHIITFESGNKYFVLLLFSFYWQDKQPLLKDQKQSTQGLHWDCFCDHWLILLKITKIANRRSLPVTTQIIGHQHEYFLLANISKWGIMCYSHCSWLLTLNWLKRIIAKSRIFLNIYCYWCFLLIGY